MFNSKRERYTLFSVALTASLLTLLFSSAYWAGAAGETTITEGSFRETASYVIWKDGSTYYAKDGPTGQVTSSSNASYLITSLIDDDVYIIFRENTFTLTNEILVSEKSNVDFSGQGSSTKLVLGNGALTNIFHIYRSDCVTISNLELDGNIANNPTGSDPLEQHGILVSGSNFFSAHHTYIHDCGWGGITVLYESERSDWVSIYNNRIVSEAYAPIQLGGNAANGTTTIQGGFVYDNLIKGNASERIGNVGIVLFQCQQIDIHDNTITSTGDDCLAFDNSYTPYPSFIRIVDNEMEQGNIGIFISDSGGGNLISGNAVKNCRYQGIVLFATNERVTDNLVIGNQKQGIYVVGGYNTIGGNIIKNNGQGGIDTEGILLSSETSYFNVLYGNSIFDDQGSPTQKWGIYEDGANGNVILSSHCKLNSVGGIHVEGVDTVISDCWNNSAYIPINNNMNLDFNQKEIENGVFHTGSTPPSSPVEGQWFYDTDDHTLYVWNSTDWVSQVGSGVTDHGDLTGLEDDDHPQYLLADGTRDVSGDLNMTQHEITDFVVDPRSTAPSNPLVGQMYYDTDDNVLYVWNNTAWHEMCEIPVGEGDLPRLHITGNQIRNPSEEQVLLRGVAGGAYNNWLGTSQEQHDQYGYMQEWGCKAKMFVVPMPPFWDMPDLDILETNVEWAAESGMYSLIDCYESWNVGWIFGDFTEEDWTAWKNAWAAVATRFAGNPNVIYGIAVEPAGISAETWVQRARECIDVIRAIDPDVIIICEALSVEDWYDDGLNYQKNIGINRPNIIFDLHMYLFEDDYETDPSYSGLLSYLTAKGVIWCHDNGYPVISQQFGFDSRNTNGPTWAENIFQIFSDYDFSYTNWVWGPFQTEDEWLNLCTDWYGNPSVQGLILQEYLTGG